MTTHEETQITKDLREIEQQTEAANYELEELGVEAVWDFELIQKVNPKTCENCLEEIPYESNFKIRGRSVCEPCYKALNFMNEFEVEG